MKISIKEILEHCNCSAENIRDLNQEVAKVVIDSRKTQKNSLYIAFKGEKTDGHFYIEKALAAGALAAVTSPSYQNEKNFPIIRVSDPALFLNEAAAYWTDKIKATKIAITGTNGKTTTKEMLFEVFSQSHKVSKTDKNLNNHLGVPLTILDIDDQVSYSIIEMGTNHFGEIKALAELAKPDQGVITNIGDGHLEFFKNRDGVLKAKLELFDYLKQNEKICYFNVDDSHLGNYNTQYDHVVSFALNKEADYCLTRVELRNDGCYSFVYNDVRINLHELGYTTLKNALCVLAIAANNNISITDIKKGLESFRNKDKRYQQLSFKNSKIILDCYNSNPSSLENAILDIAKISPKAIYILGDMKELGDKSISFHQDIARKLAEIDYKEVLFFGEEMLHAYKELKTRSKYFESFEQLKAEFLKITDNYEFIFIKGSRSMQLEKLLDLEEK